MTHEIADRLAALPRRVSLHWILGARRSLIKTPDPRDSLALWLGQLVMAWGQLEGILSLIVHVLHYEWGGHSGETEAPRALGRKIAFLKACFRDKPELACHPLICEGGAAVAIAAQQLGAKRHVWMHGHIIGEPNDLLILSWDRIRKGGDEAATFATEDDLIELVGHVLDVIPVASVLVEKLREASPNPFH